MRRTRRLAIAIACICGAAASGGAAGGEPPSRDVPAASWVQTAFPTTLATFPYDSEGLTVDPATSTLYVAESPDSAGDCNVRSISMSGVVTAIGIVPRISAAACAPRGLEFRDGALYIADQGAGDVGWVFRMDPATGQADIFASGVPGANGIAFDGHGHLWITDSLRGFGRVYRRHRATGVVEEILRVPPVANGTAYGGLVSAPSSSGIGRQTVHVPPGIQPEVKQAANGVAIVGRGAAATLYIADTARGALWAATLDERGDLIPGQTGCNASLQPDTLCEDAVFVQHPRLEGADGMWVDQDGSLWVAANSRQGIVRVDRQGRVTEVFRNPLNSQLLRSSADTPAGDTHILEYPTNPVIVPAIGSPYGRRLCVTSSDRPGRDNWPGTVGEIGGPGRPKGKVSCF
jgi:sugar lactone lactonase YvrE